MYTKRENYFVTFLELLKVKYTTMKHVSLFIGLACLFVSCIDEFIPQGIEEVRGILVVEGTIQNGESVFRISYSVGMSDSLDSSAAINDAEIYVESNDGMRIPALFIGNGAYIAQTPVLDAEKEYRLSALIDGEICESAFLAPVLTVEIDSIFPIKKSMNDPVEICIATHDPDNNSIYYKWTYRETWEVKAELYANARWHEDENGRMIDRSKLIEHSLFTPENTYYCWGRDSSKTILMASTERLSENRVAQQPLLKIPCDHDKLSVLYHIEVKQMQLREAAYKYFDAVNKQVDRKGTMFDPVMTTAIRGNIYFRNNPDRMVIGYIEVATVMSMDRYIWEREGLYEPPPPMCTSSYTTPDYTVYMWNKERFDLTTAYYNIEEWADKRCVDCRIKENASKLKPPGWPTDHL